MYFYILPKVGSGGTDDPARPDVPQGVSYVCDVIQGNLFLVGTSSPLSGKTEITRAQLEVYCLTNAINSSEVLNRWFAGGD